jgi:hypothetical protein
MALEPIVIRLDSLSPNKAPIATPAGLMLASPEPTAPTVAAETALPVGLGVPTEDDRRIAAEYLATPEGAKFVRALRAARVKGTRRGKSLAEKQEAEAKVKAGPLTMPFEVEGKTLFARRFSTPEILHIVLLMPLDNEGFIVAQRTEKIEILASEILRLGLARDAAGTPYFEPWEDVPAFAGKSANEAFCTTCLTAIDAFTRILPRRPLESPAPPTEAKPAPKTRRTPAKPSKDSGAPAATMPPRESEAPTGSTVNAGG